MSGQFEVFQDPVLGEEVWLATTTAGLRIRVLPREHIREAAAAIAFNYGSVDLEFEEDGRTVQTPAGTAHYLEHKLFEDEELAVFQRFAQRGARVNAQTGFSRTTYYFLATSAIRENLQDLLRLVAKPHITQENVDKERGIIAQEVQMYEDSADYCTAFDLLGCMYPEHPVRYTVGGTTDSINEITPELLMASWRAFYRTGNAALAVAGNVDPNEVLELAEACVLPAGPAPQCRTPADFGPIGSQRRERTMAVSRPKVLIGLKDRADATDWRARAERRARTSVVLDRMFASSSEVREALHRSGAVDDSLGAGYHGEDGFAFANIGCEHEDPVAAEAALREVLLKPVAFEEEQLERLRRRHMGAFVRGCESAHSLAFGHAYETLDEAPPFHSLGVIKDLTLDAVEARRKDLLVEDNLAVAVTRR
ncbi:MAG: pitrilysin family protein [Planctomycetota bacterium]|nr:pitrilysin family protein [Planctomycetota bacterium]